MTREERKDMNQYFKDAKIELEKRKKLDDIIRDIEMELGRATMLFGPFKSCHEGKSIIEEEFDELWDEIKMKKRNKKAMREEATQLAAMAIRFIYDLCTEEE